MSFHNVVAVTSKLPVLRTAEEAASQPKVHVSARRLRELADAGLAPHWRVDGGEPLFALDDLKAWINANLVERIEGGAIPWRVEVLQVVPATLNPAGPPPTSIAGLSGLLTAPPVPRSGVYFLCCGEVVVYVGQSINVGSRISQHSGAKDFDRAFVLPVPAEFLDEVEGAFIRALKPALNGKTGTPRGNGRDAEVLRACGVSE